MTRLDNATARQYLTDYLQTTYVVDDGRNLTASTYYVTKATHELLRLAQSITLHIPSEIPEVRALMIEHISDNPYTPAWDYACSQQEALDALEYNEAHIISVRLGGTITHILSL